MEASRLLLIPVVKEIICSHLTFEEAIKFRDALGLTSLKCLISVFDPGSDKEIILPGVNPATIETVDFIKNVFLDAAFVNAARKGYNSVVRTLLSSGDVDVNASGISRMKALVEAARNGHNSVVQTLLAAGADVDVQFGPFDYTALMVAANNGHISVVQTLLAAGADVNIKGDRFGQNALMLAAKKGHHEIVQILKAAGAR